MQKKTGLAGKIKKIARIGVLGLAGLVSSAGCVSYSGYGNYAPIRTVQSGGGVPTGLYVGSSYTDFNDDGRVDWNEIDDFGKLTFKTGERYCFIGWVGRDITRGQIGNAKLEIYGRVSGTKIHEACGQFKEGGLVINGHITLIGESPKSIDIIGVLKCNGDEIRRSAITITP